MATLELELIQLRVRVERLEAELRRLRGEGPDGKPPAQGDVDRDRLIAWLTAEGLVVAPPSMAEFHVERWQSLPEQEKEAVRWELDHLPPSPMVSDIVIENRR